MRKYDCWILGEPDTAESYEAAFAFEAAEEFATDYNLVHNLGMKEGSGELQVVVDDGSVRLRYVVSVFNIPTMTADPVVFDDAP